MGGIAYTHPESLADETIETYFRPFVENLLTKAQMQQYAVSMADESVRSRSCEGCGNGRALREWYGD